MYKPVIQITEVIQATMIYKWFDKSLRYFWNQNVIRCYLNKIYKYEEFIFAIPETKCYLGIIL